MVAQRRDASKAATAASRQGAGSGGGKAPGTGDAPSSSSSGKGSGGNSGTKLSFKQKFALENLPKEIARLEAAIARAETTMADPNLFSKDPKRFQALAAELNRDRAALAGAENEWLELEMLRDEVGG